MNTLKLAVKLLNTNSIHCGCSEVVEGRASAAYCHTRNPTSIKREMSISIHEVTVTMVTDKLGTVGKVT